LEQFLQRRAPELRPQKKMRPPGGDLISVTDLDFVGALPAEQLGGALVRYLRRDIPHAG
jgi:hypothetical protein